MNKNGGKHRKPLTTNWQLSTTNFFPTVKTPKFNKKSPKGFNYAINCIFYQPVQLTTTDNC